MMQLELLPHSAELIDDTYYDVNHDEINRLVTLTYTCGNEDPVTVTLKYSHTGELSDLANDGTLVNTLLSTIIADGKKK